MENGSHSSFSYSLDCVPKAFAHLIELLCKLVDFISQILHRNPSGNERFSFLRRRTKLAKAPSAGRFAKIIYSGAKPAAKKKPGTRCNQRCQHAKQKESCSNRVCGTLKLS